MKKQLLFLLAATLLAGGCTTKEQDMQIRLFWLNQLANLSTKTTDKDFRQLQQQLQALSLQEQAPLSQLKKATVPAQQPGDNADTPAAEAPGTATRKAIPQPQIMDVTLEDDVLPGKAPYADRIKMQQTLNSFRQSNQNTLADIGNAFNEQVKSKAFYITAQTEKSLKQTAKTSADFQTFSAAFKKAAAQQNKQLRQLMTQNKNQLKKLRR